MNGFGFYGRFFTVFLKKCDIIILRLLSLPCPPSENSEDQIIYPGVMGGLSSAQSPFHMCLSWRVGYQVGKPSLISHLEQEEELRMVERNIKWGASLGE